jgi:SAM-dependent methyltransferase
MSAAERFHAGYVHRRRVRVLARAVAPLVAEGAHVVDVGAGDGALARELIALRGDLEVEGVDVLIRPDALIPVREYDGVHLPYEDRAVDTVLLIDVLHHTTDPVALLRECARIARAEIVVKDHVVRGLAAARTLRFMDRVGNARHGVSLPHTYLDRDEWRDAFDSAGVRVTAWDTRLGLYPFPASLVFDRRLHFVARLVPAAADGPQRLPERHRHPV